MGLKNGEKRAGCPTSTMIVAAGAQRGLDPIWRDEHAWSVCDRRQRPMNDDDLDFERMMAMQGVQPIGAPRTRGPQSPPPPNKPLSRPAVRPAIVRVTELHAVEKERDEARAESKSLSAQVASLEAELASKEARVHALSEELEAERRGRTEDAESARTSAEEVREELGLMKRSLEYAEGQLSDTRRARTSLADALTERGCVDASEMLTVLNGLLLQRPSEFLGSLVLADPHALAKVLVERVAFVSSAVDFEPGKNTVVVRVPKKRCEICSGSDIASSFHGFVQACLDHDVSRVTIVGGSPAYRRQLSKLAEQTDDAPRLNLVSGTRRRESRKAQSDMRGSDVVVIWGGGELDHSVSQLYRGGDTRVVRISHRGIARMLQLARSALRGGGDLP